MWEKLIDFNYTGRYMTGSSNHGFIVISMCIYIYMCVYVCMVVFHPPTPHHKQLKERAPPHPFRIFSQKVRIHPHSTSHHFLDLNPAATPKETHVFCCYHRIKWSLNLQQPWFRGGDDRMTSGCPPRACLGNMFFSFFWCNKKTSQTRCINQS